MGILVLFICIYALHVFILALSLFWHLVICQEGTIKLFSFVSITAVFIDFINYFTPTLVDKRPKLNISSSYNVLNVLKYVD